MKICCVFNFPSHYRFPVYDAMGRELGCDFFLFDSIFQNIKSFDTSKLTGFQKTIHSVRLRFKGLLLHTGISSIFERKYTHYIVTGSSTYLINWLILLYSKLSGKKIYIWCHGLHEQATKKRSRLVAKMFFSHANGLLMYNSFFAPNMVDIGCDPSKIHYIHNSLDTEKQTEIYNSISKSNIYSNHFGNDDPVVIYIGRVQRIKRLDMLVNAISILNDSGRKVNLVIVGGVTDDYSLNDQIKELNIQNRVWLYGSSYNELENAQLLYNASVCVCPEQVGLTSIHSLTYGTPCVTNDDFVHQGPEFEAITNNITGSFYKAGDVTELAKHIWRWANVSEFEREEIRRNARQTILREWSVDFQINLLRQVLA